MNFLQKVFVEAGFLCLGIFVGFVLWRFMINLRVENITIWKILVFLGLALGATAMKRLTPHDPVAIASYFIGLAAGVISQNIWGVIWRKELGAVLGIEVRLLMDEMQALRNELKTFHPQAPGLPAKAAKQK